MTIPAPDVRVTSMSFVHPHAYPGGTNKCGPALRQQPGPCPTPDETGVEVPNDTATHRQPARPDQRADEPTPIVDILSDLLDDLEARYLANEREDT